MMPRSAVRVKFPPPGVRECVKVPWLGLKADAREWLEGRAEQIGSETEVPIHTHLRLGAPEKEIVELAEEIDAGLVVLGSRGLGGVRRALMGGVSDAVVRHARCPVLVVRTEDDA